MRIGALSSFAGRGRNPAPAPPVVTYEDIQRNIPDLIALWLKGESSGTTMQDAVGTRHGTYSGTVAFGADLPEGSGSGVDFLGTGSASVPHDSGLALSEFTFHTWFNATELVEDEPGTVVLVSKENATTPSEGDWRVMLDEAAQTLRIRIRDAALGTHFVDSEPDSATLGQEHALCIRADSGGMEALIDARVIGEITGYTGAWSANDEPLLFALNAIDSIFANTVLGNSALYSRRLNDSEVRALAKRTEPPVANADVVNVPEGEITVLDVTSNDDFVGTKADLVVEIGTQPGGGDSVAVDANNDIEYTAGSVVADTERNFTYRITDANGTSETTIVTVTVIDSATSSADAPFFGLAIGDDLANCGPNNSNLTGSDPNNTQSEFFWAERTGVVTHFRHQWRMDSSRPGAYSDGNGGRYTIQIRPASASTKRPIAGSSPVCQFTNYLPGNSSSTGIWVVHQFTLQGELTEGSPYCLVYINTATNPGSNYVSSNLSLHSRGSHPTPPSGGWTPINVPSGQDHKPYPTMVQFPPTLQTTKCGMGHWNIRYADGQWTGCSNPATISDPRSHVVQGNSMVRHRFRPWRNHTVDGVWVNIQRRNASGGSVVATLESGPASLTSGNGTTIEQVSLAASQLLDIGSFQELESGHQAYFSFIAFSESRALVSGTIYTIRLSASGGADLRQNAGYRFQGSASDKWSPAFNDFNQHEAGQSLSWSAWEYSLGLQVSTDGGANWSFPTGDNRQTCPLLLRCV